MKLNSSGEHLNHFGGSQLKLIKKQNFRLRNVLENIFFCVSAQLTMENTLDVFKVTRRTFKSLKFVVRLNFVRIECLEKVFRAFTRFYLL